MMPETLKQRIQNALIVLNAGHTFKVGELTFSNPNEHQFLVTGWSQCTHLENLTKQGALHELQETKDQFKEMIFLSSELADFIKEKEVSYSLSWDYGNGAIEICTEVTGEIHWSINLV
jgi:hypothetical protein